MKKSYFRSVLDKFEKSGFRLWEVLVADEVSCFDTLNTLKDEDYDIICNYIYKWAMNSEATPNELARVIDGILRDKEYTIKDFDDDSEELQETIENRL